MTGMSIFGFAMLKIVIWLGVLALAVALGRKLWREMSSASVDTDVTADEAVMVVAWPEVLWLNRYYIGGWALIFFAALFWSQVEMGYRPKTVIQPANPVLEMQLREIDRLPAPDIKPAEGDLRDRANQGYNERNVDENAAARKQFMELPVAE